MFFAWSQKHFCFPDTNFASDETMKTMLISFQCRSLSKSCFLAGHAQKKGKGKERNWKDEEIEMLITLYEERPCLWDVGHKDYMNRDIKEVAYTQIDLLMS